MTDMDSIYVRFRGRTLGPLTDQKVRDLIRRGQITRMHELSSDGLSWSKADGFGDFFAFAKEDIQVQAEAAAPSDAIEVSAQDSDVMDAGAASRSEPEPTVDWYAHIGGENQGPVSFARLTSWRDAGQLEPSTLVWRSGLDSWQAATEVLPELFVAHQQPMAVDLGRVSHGTSNHSRSDGDFAALATEADRRRGWAFFFGVVLIVISSLQILIQLSGMFVAASGSAAGVNTVPAIIGAILGIAFAATLMTTGILTLQYCSQVREFVMQPTQGSALSAAKRLSSLWAFLGISSLIWLAILMSIVLVSLAAWLALVESISSV